MTYPPLYFLAPAHVTREEWPSSVEYGRRPAPVWRKIAERYNDQRRLVYQIVAAADSFDVITPVVMRLALL